MKYAVFTPLAGLALLAASLIEGEAQIVPVALDRSGSTPMVDAIWEAGGRYGGDFENDPNGSSSYVLVSADYATANPDILDPTGALPDNGRFTSRTGAVFQLQPYNGPNVLLLDGSPGELTLAPSAQASYSEISFLVSSLTPARHGSPVSFTLNYTDGQSIPLTTSAPVPLLTSAPTGEAVAALKLNSYYFAGLPESDLSPIYLDEYDFQVSAPLSEILQSVTIDPGISQLQVYAISGIDPVPEPPAGMLLLAALGGLAVAARRAGPRVA